MSTDGNFLSGDGVDPGQKKYKCSGLIVSHRVQTLGANVIPLPYRWVPKVGK